MDTTAAIMKEWNWLPWRNRLLSESKLAARRLLLVERHRQVGRPQPYLDRFGAPLRAFGNTEAAFVFRKRLCIDEGGELMALPIRSGADPTQATDCIQQHDC